MCTFEVFSTLVTEKNIIYHAERGDWYVMIFVENFWDCFFPNLSMVPTHIMLPHTVPCMMISLMLVILLVPDFVFTAMFAFIFS